MVKYNLINIIQRISRANRLDKNNPQKIAKIFIWSKDKIKLETIMNNISKTIINIKYGNEKSDVINNENKIILNVNKKIEKNYINNNVLSDIIKQLNITNYIIDDNDKIWFCAKNIIKSLGYIDCKGAIRAHINKNDRLYLKDIKYSHNIKQHPNSIYINESGMYKFILKSKMETAQTMSKIITTSLVKI